MGGIDAKHFVHLPLWAKLLCLALLGIGIAVSVAIIIEFFGATESRDWVLIGISVVQFLITAFVVAIVLFASETDANIDTLEQRAETFLRVTLPRLLERVTPEDGAALACTRPAVGTRSDIFGHAYELSRTADGSPVLRLWCGVNVRRLIVIYRFRDTAGHPDAEAFAAQLRQDFRFSLGGVEKIGYAQPHFETVTEQATGVEGHVVAVWLTADTEPDLLTNPAEKLFWAQDIAMMTESLLRTAHRCATRFVPDVSTRPRPQ